jgi:peptide/nickel transport system substrate-binding protein
MDRQFTLKDLVLFATLGLLIVLLLVAMYMVDRQWLKLAAMEHSLQEQAQDMRALRGQLVELERRIRSGEVVAGARGETAAVQQGDAFDRAYAASLQPDYAEGDWVVTAFGTGLQTITPLVSSDAYASQVQSHVLESLLTRDPQTLEWVGLLAKSWQVSDDGLTFTFQLRPEARFSDGEPLTAADVAFTFEFIMNPKIAAPRERAYYSKVESVTATGAHEVVFRFREPYFNALSLAGGLAVLPQHFYAQYLEKPEAFNQSKGLLLGSGPYRLGDARGWTPDQGMVELRRNPRYWGRVQPPFERVIWRVIENDSARLTTFRNGDIDAYSARPLEYRRLLDDAALTRRTQRFEYMSPVSGYSYIAWNQGGDGRPSRFADRRVRQAMTWLTDRQRIIDEVFLGYAEVAVSPFNPRSRQHDPALQPRPFDIEQAKALLREAGYEDRDGDGVIEDAEGRPFAFELTYFQDSEDTKRMVLLLRDIYARAGVLLKPKPAEWAVMIEAIQKRDFDAITLGWTSGIETDIYQIFHSSQIEGQADNYIGYRNSELDRLIDAARATVDEEARMPLWQAAERILYEDQPYTFLMRRQQLLFLDRRFRNLEVTRMGLNFQILPIEIYVPAPEQKYTR